MKERPILFSGEMVRAILEGRKTQTRRVIKPQPDNVRNSVFVKSGFETNHGYEIMNGRGKWRPSIFMPRWASRINLEIVNIRVERLQDISEKDAKKEGVQPFFGRGTDPNDRHPYYDCFHELWNSINGPGSWDLNPWVWVIEFRRV